MLSVLTINQTSILNISCHSKLNKTTFRCRVRNIYSRADVLTVLNDNDVTTYTSATTVNSSDVAYESGSKSITFTPSYYYYYLFIIIIIIIIIIEFCY